MCGWTVTCMPKGRTELTSPEYAPNYEAHMKGEFRDNGSVSGLHTLYGKAKKDYGVTGGDPVPDPNFAQVYSAKVTLYKYDQYEHQEASDEKLSTFWPDTMCLDHVKEATTYAWRDAKKNRENPEHLKMSRKGGEKIKWTGKVKLTQGGKSHVIWVGSPQTGGAGSKILSSFPAVLGGFL